RFRNSGVGRSYPLSLMAPDRIAENRFRQMTSIPSMLDLQRRQSRVHALRRAEQSCCSRRRQKSSRRSLGAMEDFAQTALTGLDLKFRSNLVRPYADIRDTKSFVGFVVQASCCAASDHFRPVDRACRGQRLARLVLEAWHPSRGDCGINFSFSLYLVG